MARHARLVPQARFAPPKCPEFRASTKARGHDERHRPSDPPGLVGRQPCKMPGCGRVTRGRTIRSSRRKSRHRSGFRDASPRLAHFVLSTFRRRRPMTNPHPQSHRQWSPCLWRSSSAAHRAAPSNDCRGSSRIASSAAGQASRAPSAAVAAAQGLAPRRARSRRSLGTRLARPKRRGIDTSPNTDASSRQSRNEVDPHSPRGRLGIDLDLRLHGRSRLSRARTFIAGSG